MRWLVFAGVGLIASVCVTTHGARAGLTATCNGQPATIVGSEGPDTLIGTSDVDVIQAFGGDDDISGGGARTPAAFGDVICAGDGNDVIRTQPPWGATIIAGAGDDQIYGGDGGELVRAGPGSDVIYGRANNGQREEIYAGAGDDEVYAGLGRDWLWDGPGNDLIFMGPGPDSLSDVGGNDEAHGGPGFDKIASLRRERSSDVFGGGPDRDQLHYSNALGPVFVNLATGRSRGSGRDRVLGFESVFGSSTADDVLIGNRLANGLRGLGGSDRIFGRRGNDTLLGGPNVDFLYGGAGRDKCGEGEHQESCERPWP